MTFGNYENFYDSVMTLNTTYIKNELFAIKISPKKLLYELKSVCEIDTFCTNFEKF